MSRYECCYSSGRQFIFTESSGWLLAVHVTVCLGGCFSGLCIFFAISFAGVRAFEITMVCMAFLAATYAYRFTFHGNSSSVDISSYAVMIVTFAALLTLFLSAVRLSLVLDLGAMNRCALFVVSGVVLGLLVHGYVTLTCTEDQRKHYLGLCGSEGAFSTELSVHSEEEEQDSIWKSHVRFWAWIFSRRFWIDLQDWSLATDAECKSGDVITVHNNTLKLIKVCMYSPEDVFCWVPFGGISGQGVGLINAGTCRSFNLPQRGSDSDQEASNGHYRLKVFQPGLLDKELACYPKAQCGQSFAFYDVEGMVRHSRLLSDSRSPLRCPAAAESSEDEMSCPGSPTLIGSPSRSSSDFPSLLLQGKVMRAAQRDFELQPRGHKSPSRACNPGLFKRHWSSENLQELDQEEAYQGSDAHPVAREGEQAVVAADRPGVRGTKDVHKENRPEVRRAGPDEVVVRNRSNQEICARLFRLDDYCYLVPLGGMLSTIGCGDCILPDMERRFNPLRISARDFTLKVYSVGPGSKELTYFTVSRGHTYTFCDSLLS